MRLKAAFGPIAVIVLAFALVSGFAIPSWAQTVRQSVLLIIQPSAADAVTWGVARDTLSRVNDQVIDILADEPPFAEVLAAHNELRSAVDAGQGEISYIQLDGVSIQLARAFEKGNLPQGNLFSAASAVTPLTAEQAEESTLTRIVASQSTVDHQEISALIENLNAAIDALPAEQLAAIRGDLTASLPTFTDEKLEQIVDLGGDRGAAAQTELDRRLAASLPDLTAEHNGLVSDDLLCTIPWAPEDRILCAALPNLTRMSEAFKAEFGTDIPILDGYRPLSEQITVYQRDPNWTAVPGTSNHGWGMAVDLGWDTFREWDAPEVQWMLNNGYKYGWRLPKALSRESDRPEPWHYEFGTSYSQDDSADFVGPTPDVIYKVPLPAQH